MKIQPDSKIVFIGDSITDAGRTPAGEGLFDPRGKGYVNMVESLLTSTYPERRIRVINQGNSGHTVRDLKGRWKTDVMDRQPDWVFIMIGTNDVWRQFDSPLQPEGHVPFDEYVATLTELVVQTQPKVKGLVLMTPFYIEPNKSDAMRAQMDRYGAAVKALAEKAGTLFVDTQAAFDALLPHCHSSYVSWDRVHPNQSGHMVIARAVLKALDYKW